MRSVFRFFVRLLMTEICLGIMFSGGANMAFVLGHVIVFATLPLALVIFLLDLIDRHPRKLASLAVAGIGLMPFAFVFIYLPYAGIRIEQKFAKGLVLGGLLWSAMWVFTSSWYRSSQTAPIPPQRNALHPPP